MNYFDKSYKYFISIALGMVFILFFFWGNLTTPAINISPAVGTNDLTDLYYPFFHQISESYQKGEIPLWVSELSSGYPLLAGAVGTLYPINIILSIFPTITTINMTILVSYFLIYLASFLYARRIKLGYFGSILAATLITFSGFSVTQLLHFDILVAFYLLLFELYLLEGYLQNKGVWQIFLMGILLGLAFLGGHPQINLYSMLVIVPYWLLRANYFQKSGFNTKKFLTTFMLVFPVFLFIGIGIGAAQLLPMAEFTQLSTRSTGLANEVISRFNFPLSDLITLVLPFARFNPEHTIEAFYQNGWPADERYAYLSILGLVIGIIGLLKSRQWKRYGQIFLILTILSVVFILGDQLTIGQLMNVPPFSFFRGAFKITFITTISLSLLAGCVFERFINWIKYKTVDYSKQKAINLKQGLLIIVVLIVTLGTILVDLKINAQKLHPEVNANDWYREPKSVSFLKDKLQDQERVTSQQYFYPSVKIFLQKPELWDDPQIFLNLRNLIPVFNNFIYDIPKNTGAANSAGLKVSWYNDLEQEIFFGGLIYSREGIAEMTDTAAFLNRMMGVRFLLAGQPIKHFILSPANEITFDNGQDPVIIYEFTDYYPRTFMVPKAETATPEEIKKHLVEGDFDPKKIVYIEESTDWGAKGGYAATALFESYSDHEVIIKTQASGDGWLYLSDTYYPGWKAYVDGVDTKIYRANYAFRAVPVPEGKHEVIFKFESDSFYLGVKVSLITFGISSSLLLVSITWSLWRKFLRTKRK